MTTKKHNASLRSVSAVPVAAFSLVWACGPIIDPGLIDDMGFEPGTATLANFRSWEKDWQTGSWIVTVEDAGWRSPASVRQRLFRGQVLDALYSTAVGGEVTGGLTGLLPEALVPASSGVLIASRQSSAHQDAWDFLNQNVDVEMISTMPTLPWQPGIFGRAQPPTFLHVSLKDGRHTGPFFLELIGWASNPNIDDARRRLAHWQLLSLRRLEGVEEVEPNLFSRFDHPRVAKPFSSNAENSAPSFRAADDHTDGRTSNGATAYTPPEFEFRSPMVENLRLIKADLAYNFKGQGTESRRPVNVAVLDTGVDSAHPDLAQQIWVNQNEQPENKIDDDKNGVADDIHGFDATIAADAPAGVSPRPGSDDIGGPGAACPSPSRVADRDDLVSNCGHGTHVAGIIAAQHGADTRTLGVCPNCRIMSVRVSERCVQPDTARNGGECVLPTQPLKESQYEVDGNISDIAQVRALQYLFNTRKKGDPNALEVNIVNMSLGKYFRSRAMSYLIQLLQDANVLVVAAAGNDDTDTPSYPAAYDSVVAVCATSSRSVRGSYAKAEFSNFGEWVDICAPGRDIFSTVPGKIGDGSGNTDEKSGTSQATPFVSGALGYLMSVSPSQVGVRELVRTLQQSALFRELYYAKANTLGSPNQSAYLACYSDNTSCDYLLGSGFLNLFKAVNPAAQDPFTQVDFSKEPPIEGGCVVSAVGKTGTANFSAARVSALALIRAILASVPFLLGISALILWACRKRHIRSLGAPRGSTLRRSKF
jgi:subtilisin family serine protease